MKRSRRRKCLHCHQLFTPDARNRRHQRYCGAPDCRCASKAASQGRWLSKAENRDYFSDPIHVTRVQAWRQAHPGYTKRGSQSRLALQEDCMGQVIEPTAKIATLTPPALQELLLAQPFVLLGLIANLTGSSLQEDIACSGRQLEQLGRDILATGDQDEQNPVMPPTPAPHSGPVQLARSAPGPP